MIGSLRHGKVSWMIRRAGSALYANPELRLVLWSTSPALVERWKRQLPEEFRDRVFFRVRELT